jgi:hypothetical protein
VLNAEDYHSRSCGRSRAEGGGQIDGALGVSAESAWNHTRQRGRDSRFVIDLSDMTFIDRKGGAVLVAMITEGARLAAKGVYCEYVAEQLMSRARKALARQERRNGASTRTAGLQAGTDSARPRLDGHSSQGAASAETLTGQATAVAPRGPQPEPSPQGTSAPPGPFSTVVR